MDKYLISVVGPTAIGKTSLSISLAQYFNTDVVSTDSRQFFKEMKIGTAVPSKSELEAVTHHFIQNISIQDQYSVGDYEKESAKVLNQLFEKKSIVILVGGSGLYQKAVIEGLDEFPDIDPEIRQHLNKKLQTQGVEVLSQQLKELDQESFESIDINNPQRIIRALEVSIGTGRPFSSFKTKLPKKRSFKVISVGLKATRSQVYERINSRVDLMVKDGLVEEARTLYNHRNLNALNTVGYKELFAYFDNTVSLEEAIENIKKNTRRFAKRQLTWFRKDQNIKWFDYQCPHEDIIAYIETRIDTKKSSK